MGTNFYLICRECKKKIVVGKRGPSGFSFWSGEKPCMEALREMLENCTQHSESISMIDEHKAENDGYEEIDWHGES